MQLPTQILGQVHRNDSRGNVTEHKRKIRTHRRERKRMEQKNHHLEGKPVGEQLKDLLKAKVKPHLSEDDYLRLLGLINEFIRVKFIELCLKNKTNY